MAVFIETILAVSDPACGQIWPLWTLAELTEKQCSTLSILLVQHIQKNLNQQWKGISLSLIEALESHTRATSWNKSSLGGPSSADPWQVAQQRDCIQLSVVGDTSWHQDSNDDTGSALRPCCPFEMISTAKLCRFLMYRFQVSICSFLHQRAYHFSCLSCDA